MMLKYPSGNQEWTMRRGHRPSTSGKDRGKAGETPSDRPRKSGNFAASSRPFPRAGDGGGGSGTVTLWGRHAVAAALANPRRGIVAIHATARSETALREILDGLPPARRGALPSPSIRDGRDLAESIPPDAVHQGLVVVGRPLPAILLEDLADGLGDGDSGLLVVLDQVTDPHNVGAVLRSAAAFGASGVIVQNRHAPPADGVLAKAASGALERVPIIEVTNIARALDLLKDSGFWCIGLSGDGETTIDQVRMEGKIALVLGAEGPGLRRLPRERCDVVVRLPTSDAFGTLNISNAAAIALYEARGAGAAS